MKLHKLRKVDKAGNVIRLTFKKFFGGTVDRDVIKSTISSYWEYMDTGEDDTVYNIVIEAFLAMDVDCYTVNGEAVDLYIVGPPMPRPSDKIPSWRRQYLGPRMTEDQIKDSEL